MTNHRHSRRAFLGLTGAGIAGLLNAESQDADLVVFNAKVYTVDSPRPRPKHSPSRTDASPPSAAPAKSSPSSPRARTFDARQMTSSPVSSIATITPAATSCSTRSSSATLRGRVRHHREHHRETPRQGPGDASGTWVEGYFFDDTKVKDNRQLNLHDLDRVSKDHPVVVRHRGGHTAFYNSKALQMADINRNTPNPPGGTYDRDSNGDLNGRVTDRAMVAVNRIGKRQSFSEAQTAQRDRDGVAHISRRFARFGVTSVHHQGGSLPAFQQVRARRLLHRVGYESSGRVLDSMISGGIMSGFATNGSASAPLPNTPWTAPSRNAPWPSALLSRRRPAVQSNLTESQEGSTPGSNASIAPEFR